MTLRALLFDMDGTVIDSDPLHARVFIGFLAGRGIALTHADYMARMHGRRNVEIFAEILPDEDAHALDAAKEAEFRTALGASAAPMPGLTALLDRAQAAGWATALVTNACRANVEAVLDATGLAGRFGAVLLGEDCPRGKPDPEVYRRALAALDVGPVAALAFEDSPAGIAAATGAGIRTLGLATGLPPATLLAHGAHAVIRDFADPALEPLLRSNPVPEPLLHSPEGALP